MSVAIGRRRFCHRVWQCWDSGLFEGKWQKVTGGIWDTGKWWDQGGAWQGGGKGLNAKIIVVFFPQFQGRQANLPFQGKLYWDASSAVLRRQEFAVSKSWNFLDFVTTIRFQLPTMGRGLRGVQGVGGGRGIQVGDHKEGGQNGRVGSGPLQKGRQTRKQQGAEVIPLNRESLRN